MDGINPLLAPSLSQGSTPNPHASPAKVAQQFEGVFASMLIKQMRQTLDGDAMFGKDAGEVYGGMFDQFLGEHVGRQGGLGIGEMVRSALERQPSDPIGVNGRLPDRPTPTPRTEGT